MSIRTAIACAMAGAGLLAACSRPFVDVKPPETELLEPDPGSVVAGRDVTLRLRATSFRAVSRVLVDDRDAQREDDGTWTLPVTLSRGLNTFVVTAFDEEAIPGIDTLRLIRLSFAYEVGSEWPDAVGGHTATRLRDGRLLVAGGAPRVGGSSTERTWLYERNTRTFVPGPPLGVARTGHTATLLPDGRLVVMGGSVKDPPSSVADLVETVEILEPDSESFREMPFRGDPVRRAFHTATMRVTDAGPVIDLIGGDGDTRYGAQPRLNVRYDLRSFLVTADSVIALTGWFGIYIEPLTGHTQTALDPAAEGEPGRFLLAGTRYDGSAPNPVTFVLDTRGPLGSLLEPVPSPDPPRTEHAALGLVPGRVLLLGGRTPERDADGGGAVWDDAIGRFVRVPTDLLGTPTPRRRFTATFLPDGRILLLGGFTGSGTAESLTEMLYID